MTHPEGEPTRFDKGAKRLLQSFERLIGRHATYESSRVTGSAVPDMFTRQGIKDIESVPESNGRVFTVHASYDTPEFPQESSGDFSRIPKSDLRRYAQDLMEQADTEALIQLRNFAVEARNKLPHYATYSVEWDDWNYYYLAREIDSYLNSDTAQDT